MTRTYEEFGIAYDRLKQATSEDRELFLKIYALFNTVAWADDPDVVDHSNIRPVRGTDEAESLIRLLNSPYWEALFRAYLIKKANHEA